jgi:hypothetical protein
VRTEREAARQRAEYAIRTFGVRDNGFVSELASDVLALLAELEAAERHRTINLKEALRWNLPRVL